MDFDLKQAVLLNARRLNFLISRRELDIQKVVDEARSVGLDCNTHGYLEEGVGSLLTIWFGERRLEITWGKFSNVHRWCLFKRGAFSDWDKLSIAEIEELGITPEQVDFFNWSTEWETKIRPYWEGNTNFETIEEFIQNLKDTATNIYGPLIVKSANKK